MTRTMFVALVALACAGCESKSAAKDAPPAMQKPGRLALYVFVDDDGVTTVDGAPTLDDASIEARAEAFHAIHPHAGADVRCTHAALHGRTVRVLDLLREAEIDPISVQLVE